MAEMSAGEEWIAHMGKASKLGLHIRSVILSVIPGTVEEVDERSSLLAYMVGEGYKGTVVVLRHSRTGWSIGFYRGRELPDPDGLLTGNGRSHAVVNISGRADAESESLKTLLREAYSAAIRRRDEESKEVDA
ncbi:MAG TPA: hypothetical protein VGK23_11770 [Methanomassiliicoccales archaeon]|jgi:hypothetical protein